MEKYYTADEVAELLHVSKGTVRHRAKTDPAFKLIKTGNRLMMSESDLQNYIKASRAKAEKRTTYAEPPAAEQEEAPEKSNIMPADEKITTAIMLPKEHYNRVVNTGMCNSIIEGYILLALDLIGEELGKDITQIVSLSRLLDTYSAEQARERTNK